MHQTTQRRMCRLVFLAGCVLPTLAVATWAAVERLPSTATARLATVEHLLAMRVTAADVATPTPGTYRLREVVLANVETGALVLSAQQATFEQHGEQPHVHLAGVQISAEELPLLASLARRTLAVDWPGDAVIRMTDVHWHGETPASAQQLFDGQAVRLQLSSAVHNGVTSGRTFAIQLGETGKPDDRTQLVVHRNRQVSPPATRVVLNTQGKLVPANWLAQLGGLVPDGGSPTTFAGEAAITYSAGTTSGHISGEFAEVSLASMTQLPIDATASISNFQMEWVANRITSSEGVIVTGPGTMLARLALTAQRRLYDDQHPQRGAQVVAGDAVPFGALGVRFSLNDKSLSIWGACPTSDPNNAPCMVDSNANVLFGQPLWGTPLSGIGVVLAEHGADRSAEITAKLPRPAALHR